MFIFIDDNPNCSAEERMFNPLGTSLPVLRIRLQNHTQSRWLDVVGINDDSSYIPAQAILVEDSGAGSAWLVYGGAWGIRCKDPMIDRAWDLKSPSQKGWPYLVLDASGEDIQFDKK